MILMTGDGRHLLDTSDYSPLDDLSRAVTLPARWYTAPQFLVLEKERIFWKTWQPVGRLDMVLRPGDFFACEVTGEPLVVTRGLDNQLRAFSNVCRHRAGPVAVGKGNRKSLQCRYHGWTYGLDGKLLTAPEFEGVNDWDKAHVCLPEVKVEVWGPFVFVNLDPQTQPLLHIYGEIADQIKAKGFAIEQMRAFERRDYVIQCNWKVYVDNYPGLTQVAS